MVKQKPSRQAQQAGKSEGWGRIDPKVLDEFFNWLEALDDKPIHS